MLKLLGLTIKVLIFSLVVLIIGNRVHWGGRTISDQVQTQLSAAERSDIAERVKEMAKKVTGDEKKGRSSFPSFSSRNGEVKTAGSAKGSGIPTANAEDAISPSERQKLKALIRELNQSQP